VSFFVACNCLGFRHLVILLKINESGNRMGTANTYRNRSAVHDSVTTLESSSAYTQAASVCSGRSEDVLRCRPTSGSAQ
jgi:hypothetical protein